MDERTLQAQGNGAVCRNADTDPAAGFAQALDWNVLERRLNDLLLLSTPRFGQLRPHMPVPGRNPDTGLPQPRKPPSIVFSPSASRP